MRLLLDELYPSVIANELRKRGHDVEAVQAHPELRGLDDRVLFATAQEQGRALLTENVPDYARLDAEYRARDEAHHGLIFTSDAKFPRGRTRTIGALVKALDTFLGERSSTRRESTVEWL